MAGLDRKYVPLHIRLAVRGDIETAMNDNPGGNVWPWLL